MAQRRTRAVDDGEAAAEAFRGAGNANATLVDPVCGMTVDPAAPVAHRRHGERDYYFCGAMCAGAFDANPERHLAPHRP